MYPENLEGTRVIGSMSMNMRYVSGTTRTRTCNLFHLEREQIPLGHSKVVNIAIADNLDYRWIYR